MLPFLKRFQEEDLRRSVPEITTLIQRVMTIFEEVDYISDDDGNSTDATDNAPGHDKLHEASRFSL